MLTGDNRATADAIAQQVSIPADRVTAEVLPGDKAAKVARAAGAGEDRGHGRGWHQRCPGHRRRRTQDIAMGAETDVAMAASDITLIGGDLRQIVTAIALSRRTVVTLPAGGLFWALCLQRGADSAGHGCV